MFKFLRSQAKVFYWVIAGSFVLFLGLGGMTSRGCNAPGTANIEPGVIGSVNGTKITSQQYDLAVRQQIAMLRQQGANQELNANQYAEANERAWDYLVRNALVEQAIADRKIKVSDAEILDVFQNNPPAEILNQFRTEDGNIDIDAYYAALQNSENDWTSAENYVRSMLPRQKLNDEIAASAFVSDQDVRKEYIRQTGRGVAEYMGVLFTDVGADYEPAAADIQAWYEAHQDEYMGTAQAQGQVVRFAKTPSEADEADILALMNEIREDILSGRKDFATAAAEFSDDESSAVRGGDLGRFDRNRMVAPFTEAAFSLEVGELSEPVRTKFGYHLIEVTEQDRDKDSGEVYEVTARHILLKVTPGPGTLDMIREAADAFRDRVDGASFLMTAEAEAMDLIAADAVAENRDIPGLPLSLQGANWLFDAEKGEVSPVFENRDCYYVVLCEGHTPAAVRPLEEVRGQVTLAVRKEHNVEAAKAKLTPAVGEVQMGRSMAEVAEANGLAHAVTDTFTANGNIDGVGYGTDFNMDVIMGTVGELIPEIETLRGVFAATPLWVKPVDQADFEQRMPGLRAALLQRAQGEVISAWFDERIADSEIVDHRHMLRQGG